MKKNQFDLVATLLALSYDERKVAHNVLFNNVQTDSVSGVLLSRVMQADAALRGA